MMLLAAVVVAAFAGCFPFSGIDGHRFCYLGHTGQPSGCAWTK